MRPLERAIDALAALRDSAAADRLWTLGTGAARALLGLLVEVLRIAREMLVIPLQLWLALAEVCGRLVLGAWNLARPAVAAALTMILAALLFAQRRVTPGGALVVACAGGLIALAASQWVDYRGVAVGTTEYAGGVESVAPAPDVDRETAGNAHAWVMLPLAGAGALLLALALGGRRRAALLLAPLGLAVIAIGVLVDVPKGLDEGGAALAYEGAEARLLEGFWAQLAAGAVIACCGVLLAAPRSVPGAARGSRARPRRPQPGLERREGPDRRSSQLADAPIKLTERGSPPTG